MRVCVYCSSSDAVAPAFVAAARELGRLLGAGGHELVYGGASIGLMGEIARTVHEYGGRVVAVLPEFFTGKGIDYIAADDFIVTEDMRSRKATMEARADAFVTLPGGFGTLEELLEVLTLKQLGGHAKPIVIVNTDGIFDPLLAQFDALYAGHFAKPEYRALYHVAATPAEVLNYLERYEEPILPTKWFEPPEEGENP